VTLINVDELTDPAEDVPERLCFYGEIKQAGCQHPGGQCRVEAKEVRDITGDMGSSHGSSRNAFGFAVVPGGDNFGP